MPSSPFARLPDELLHHIFTLIFDDRYVFLGMLCRVCKRWRDIVKLPHMQRYMQENRWYAYARGRIYPHWLVDSEGWPRSLMAVNETKQLYTLSRDVVRTPDNWWRISNTVTKMVVCNDCVYLGAYFGLFVWRHGELIHRFQHNIPIQGLAVCNGNVYSLGENGQLIVLCDNEVLRTIETTVHYKIEVIDDVLFARSYGKLYIFREDKWVLLLAGVDTMKAIDNKLYAVHGSDKKDVTVYSSNGTSTSFQSVDPVDGIAFVNKLMFTCSEHAIYVWSNPPVRISCPHVRALEGGQNSLFILSTLGDIKEYI